MNPCQVPGCKENTHGGRYYCAEHHKQWLASPELKAGRGGERDDLWQAFKAFEARMAIK